MNPLHTPLLRRAGLCGLALWAHLVAAPAQAQALNLAQTPLFLSTAVKPNVLVVLDNSQSMDGTMAGRLIAGSDDSTRGNVARTVLRNTLTNYRNAFNWGLASYALRSTSLYTTYAYYFGNHTRVVYTNDCVGGISASNGSRRCVANPETGNGYAYITYDRSGDDPDINDVLYMGDAGPQLYGIGVTNSTNYNAWLNHNTSAGTGWASSSFRNSVGTMSFTPTDAGFLPGTYPDDTATPPNNYPRIFWLRRAWGYLANITGKGVVNRGVATDSTSHFNALNALLAKETNDNSSGELKNAAVYTPLSGTLDTVNDYFSNRLSGQPSPITESCQRNFVLMATDGMPTGKTDGSMYTLAQMANTYSGGSWSFGTAANDVFGRVTGLRSVTYGGRSYDVQTYVVGLGDTVANASAVATLNRMAELGGTRSAYLASDQAALAEAFRAVSVDILARTAAASSVALNSGAWTAGSKVFQGRFHSSDWSGQLLAYSLGSSGEPGATPDWDAGLLLNARAWDSGSTARRIITYKPGNAIGSRGVAFRWPADASAPAANEIDSTLVAALNKNATGTTDGFGQQRLEYLRGNTAREERNCSGCAAPVFRSRPQTVLGDIVNSSPVYLSGATGDYRDTLEAARYSSYAASRSGMAPLIFVGANDGMLHAFNASSGAEVFAYVPYAVRQRLPALTANPYTHLYTVDGLPSVGDAYTGGAWRTMLVSGLGAGAPGLFALDVTNAAGLTEATAGGVARWELGDSDADVGHIFSRPILAKTRDGRWRAIVGNGYNSANGHAVLLLVDLDTGAVARIDTGVGSADAPNGLSAVTTVSTADNGVVDVVYAGDLRGNLWKFDLSASAASGWGVAYRSGTAAAPLFTAASGQAITARPDVTRMAGGGYMVSVGTGRYVDVADNSSTGTQALYGIWDQGAAVAASQLQTQTVVRTASGSDGRTYRLSTHAVGLPGDTALAGDNAITKASYLATKRGWKLELPTSGERVVTEAVVRAGRLVVTTLIPGTTSCAGGGDGWVMDLDVATGNRAPALDTNGDGVVSSADHLSGTMASGVQVGSVPSAASIMRSRDRTLDDKLINTSAGTILKVREAGSSATSRRTSWEQLR